MSWRIAYDPAPEDPNPHAWALEPVAFGTQQEASLHAQNHTDELIREYGEEYAFDSYRWLVVADTVMEVNVT